MVHDLHTVLVLFGNHVTPKWTQLVEMSSWVQKNPCSITESIFELMFILQC